MKFRANVADDETHICDIDATDLENAIRTFETLHNARALDVDYHDRVDAALLEFDEDFKYPYVHIFGLED